MQTLLKKGYPPSREHLMKNVSSIFMNIYNCLFLVKKSSKIICQNSGSQVKKTNHVNLLWFSQALAFWSYIILAKSLYLEETSLFITIIMDYFNLTFWSNQFLASEILAGLVEFADNLLLQWKATSPGLVIQFIKLVSGYTLHGPINIICTRISILARHFWMFNYDNFEQFASM